MAQRWGVVDGLVCILPMLCAGACATRAMSQDQANQLSNLKVKEFLKVRFADTETSGALQGVTSVGTKMDVFLGRKSKREADAEMQEVMPQVKPDGSVVLHGFYTDANQDQVLRPAIELRRFCQAQEGQFSAEIESRNMVKDAYAQRDATDAEWCAQQTPAIPFADCATAVGVHHEQTDRENDRMGSDHGYQLAAKKGAFGKFSCAQNEKSKHESWAVVIKAVGLAPRQKGSLIGHDLTLVISPR